MNFGKFLLLLILFCVKNIYGHNDKEKKPKVLLISFTNYENDIFERILLNFSYVELSLNPVTHDKFTNLISVINGCFPENKLKCEPIWVKNQRNDFDSAFLNWPNQSFYDITLPTYDYGCGNSNNALNFKLRRMQNWMTKPKTTLGFMYVDGSPDVSQFLDDVSKFARKNDMNIILIAVNSTKLESKYVAMGPKFKTNVKPVVSIKLVDIYSIIDNVLLLTGDKHYTDGNVTLASLLIKMPTDHIELNVLKLVIIGVIIAVSVVISCTIFIGAVKNTCGKVQKVNHQYNLGLKNTSGHTGFPEHAYLLNGSDEDELFSDGLPHVQTSRQPS